MTSPEANAVRPHWKGFSAIEYLIIFGDSYSAVGYDSSSPHPDRQQPLGVPKFGYTYTEDDDNDEGTPNWVGWLVTDFAREQNILVYDYAVGGVGVDDIPQQLHRHFLPTVGQRPEWAPWTADNSLFVTWIGINDLAFHGESAYIRQKLETLFKQEDALYKAGARNFLFIDVPPIQLSPAGGRNPSPERAEKYMRWNTLLSQYVAAFAAEHEHATTMVFSSHIVFSDIIQNPVKYGFQKDHARKFRGTVWVDHIHPTSKVHRVVADNIMSFLGAQLPYKPDLLERAEMTAPLASGIY